MSAMVIGAMGQHDPAVYVVTEQEDDCEFPCVVIGVFRDPDAAIAEADRLSRERYHVGIEEDDEDRDVTWHIEETELR